VVLVDFKKTHEAFVHHREQSRGEERERGGVAERESVCV
jgi:hypothetical protein